jgi:hypothetical protein
MLNEQLARDRVARTTRGAECVAADRQLLAAGRHERRRHRWWGRPRWRRAVTRAPLRGAPGDEFAVARASYR